MTDTPQIIPENEEDESVLDERTIGRRIALQALYEIDLANHPVGEVLYTHLQTQQPGRRIAHYVQEVVNGVSENRPVLDETVQRYAPEFPLDQIAVIDRNILRLAVFEFAVRRSTPVGAAIDEAVELAKMFGADGASSFINGVLGALADDKQWLRKLRQVESNDDGDPT